MSTETVAPPIRITSVLIATDFSPVSEKAARHGLAIARHYGAHVCLLHVVSAIGFTMADPGVVSAATEVAGRDMRRWEEELVRTGRLAGVACRSVVCHGDVAECLECVVRDEHVDLVVLGTHARHGLGKVLLGSVAEHVFHESDCPVVTVGPNSLPDSPVGGARAVRPLVFATDFSEGARRALPYAISFANTFAARLIVLNVQPVSAHGRDRDRLREETRRTGLQHLRESLPPDAQLVLPAEFRVEFGDPARKILETADAVEADGIVLGLCRSPAAETGSPMPWSTAYQVVCGARCAVVTVRS